MPTIVGSGGAETVLQPDLSAQEREQLERSAQVLRDAYASVRGA